MSTPTTIPTREAAADPVRAQPWGPDRLPSPRRRTDRPLFSPGPRNLDVVWENPALERFFRRLATFDGPARAIRCALAVNEAVAGLGIEVRTGLHTGEVELRGEDVGGIAVHIAARVMAEASPGEVLVSGAVPPLVAGSGIEFSDRGVRALKGVPGEWRLLSVAG